MQTLSNPLFLALKAGLAVALALSLVKVAGLSDALSAGFAALACTTPVVMTGVRRGWEQVVASLVGGTVSWLALVLLPNQAWVTGLAVLATVLVIFKIGLAHTFLIAGFTVLYVFIIPAETPGFALEQRLLSLACGVGSATLVNVAISAAFYRSLFRRRVRLLRLALADAFPTLAQQSTAADRSLAPTSFDSVFPLVWTLGADLSDALRETAWRPSHHVDVRAHHDTVRQLAALAHLGRELGHVAERSEEHGRAVARGAVVLEKLVRDGSDPLEFEGVLLLGPVWGRAVELGRGLGRGPGKD